MQPSSTSADPKRAQVSRDYAGLVQRHSVGCQPPQIDPTGDGRYAPGDLERVPADAVELSMGCGNPLAFSAVQPGDTVLDLGSGAGLDLILAARKTGPAGQVIGVDMTEAMNARARQNVAQAGLQNVEVRRGIIEDLPVESASVDWVISNCVLNLSPEKHRVFGEVARVLRPGGRLQISDIVIEDVPRWTRWVAGRFSAAIAWSFAEADYLSGLRAAGLEDVAVVVRQRYDASTLAGFLDAELSSRGRLTRLLLRPLARLLARTAAGRVVSIKVHARRPA